MANLKKFIRDIKTINFSPNNLKKLHDIDKYGAFKEGINIYLYVDPMTKQIKSRMPETDHFLTILFSTYLIEAFIAYAEGNKDFIFDFSHWKEVKNNKTEYISLRNTVNLTSNFFTKPPSSSINSIAKILIPTAFEQMDLQISYSFAYRRFYNVYASNETINQIFKDREGISLKKYMALSWVIYAFILKNKPMFNYNQLISFIDGLIPEEEVKIFLNMISLTRGEFKTKYLNFRRQDDGSFYDYEHREYFDKGLPKISFFYPLLRIENTYILNSYTAFHEFFKMKAIYRYMTENFTDINFKSLYAGPEFENYVHKLVEQYNTRFDLGGLVYGNKEYYPKKGVKWHEPDVVFETNDYLIIIECKTTPYSLNLLKFTHNNDLERLKESISVSIDNIDKRFLVYYHEKFKNKKIVRIVVFYEAIEFIFSLLQEELSETLNRTSIHIMDIRTLELMLSDYIEPLPNIFDKFEVRNRSTNDTIQGDIHNIFSKPLKDEEEDEILKELLFAELGLPYTEW